MYRFLEKLITLEGIQDFFTVTDENDELDGQQVAATLIQAVVFIAIIAAIGYFLV